MIWAEKLAKSHTLARDWLQKARRQSNGIEEGSMDDFMNKMGLGDPDPSNHRTGFDGADEIVDWLDKPEIGGNVTNRSLCSVIDKDGKVTHYIWDDEKAVKRTTDE